MAPADRPRRPDVRALLPPEYRLEQLVAVPTWRAVTWDSTQHVTHRVYLLALATNTVTNEPGMLVGLTYTPRAGWTVVDLAPDFCGLLPPDWDLVPFQAENPCGHTPAEGAG